MNLKFLSVLPLAGLLAVLAAPADDSVSAPGLLPPDVQKLIDDADTRKTADVHIDGSDPLAAAWLLSAQIAGDHDVACQQQLRCIMAMSESGRAEEAAKLTREITDYRSALGSLHCAEALLGAGRKELALEQMERVEKVLGVVKPWQQNVIRVRMAAAGAQAGWDDTKIESWLKPLELVGDRFGARVLVLVRRMLKEKTFNAVRFDEVMKEKLSRKSPVPELVEAAGLLLTLAPGVEDQDKMSQPEISALISAFEVLLLESHAYPAPALLDLAEFWHARGDAAKARAALARAEPQIGYHLDGGAELYYRMALLRELKGSADDVRPFFEKLEAKARSLAPMYRPAALVWLGACWHELGESNRESILTEEAFKEASANPNSRMRLIGGMEICLCYARTGRPLGTGLASQLDGLLRGNGGAEPPKR
jgi:hypothetical protein